MTSPSPYGSGARGFHLTNRERWERINLLALGELSQQEIAERFGITRESVAEFAKRYRAQIEAARERINNEIQLEVYAASKFNRLYDADEDYRLIRDRLHRDLDESDSQDLHRLAGLLVKLRHSIAEELGDLPTRSTVEVQSSKVTHEIVGWDQDKFLQALAAAKAADGEGAA